MLQQGVQARHVRFIPQSWHGEMSMRVGVLTEARTFIGKGLADHGKQLDVLESCFCPRDWKRFEALDVDVGEGG